MDMGRFRGILGPPLAGAPLGQKRSVLRLSIFLFVLLTFLLPPGRSTAQAGASGAFDSLYRVLGEANGPKRRVDAHLGLWEAYINTDVDSALAHARRIVRLGLTMSDDSIVANGQWKKGIAFAYANRLDSSGACFRRALAHFREVEDARAMAGILRNLGQDHNMLGTLDSAAHYYALAEEHFALAGDSVGLADIHNSQAILFLMRGYFNLALDKAISAERVFSRSRTLAGDLNQNRLVVAAIYGSMSDTLNAIIYHRKAAAYFEEQGLMRQFVSNGILMGGFMVERHRDHPELEGMIRHLVAASTDLQDQSLVLNVRLLEARWHVVQGHPEAGLKVLDTLVRTASWSGDELGRAALHLAMGMTLFADGQVERAISELERADGLFRDFGMRAEQRTAKEYLARAHERAGDFRSSLAYQKEFQALDKELFDERRTRQFDELQTVYETEQKEHALAIQEQTIARLYAEAKANRTTRLVYGLVMISLILVAGLTVVAYRQKMKKEALERQRQVDRYQQEIAYKKRQLTSQTLHLVQKNAFIQELKEKLASIKASPDRFVVEYGRITSLLQRHSAEDESWEVFKAYFSEVHNDFDVLLKSMAPDITEYEVRLASFLRMNLTINEIASLLHVQPQSVMKSKYRLKKKLGLGKDVDLDGFLGALKAA